MSKVIKKTTPSKKPQIQRKKITIRFKKPDFKAIAEKLKKWNWKPVAKIVGLILVIVGSFTLVDFGVQYLNNDYSVAVVNGTRIPTSEWHRILERAYGSAAATELIENEIVKQEAKKADITVTDEEVQTELDSVISSVGGQELYEAALKSNDITEEELKDEIEISLLTTKLLTPLVTYTDDDVKSFFNEYSSVLFPDETEALADGEKLDYDTYKSQATEVYVQQQIETQKTSWLTEKKAEYKIQDNSTDKPSYGLFTTTINIINNLLNKSDDTATE